MEIRLVTGNVVSGVVNPENLNARNLTHIMLNGVNSKYNTISLKFVFECGTIKNIQSITNSFHAEYGKIYTFEEIVDVVSSIEITPYGIDAQMIDTMSCLSIETSGRVTYDRSLKLGEETLITTYNFPVGSKLYFHEDLDKSVEYFGIKPSWVYVNNERIGAMIKNIQGDSSLYYKQSGRLYKAIYGNGGDDEGGLTKTHFTLV